jgi:hypothetical protein
MELVTIGEAAQMLALNTSARGQGVTSCCCVRVAFGAF